MSARVKKKSFAELCVNDHKKVIANAIRKIAGENGWGCVALAEHSKSSAAACSYILRGDESRSSLHKLCLMAYELGVSLSIRIVNPNE